MQLAFLSLLLLVLPATEDCQAASITGHDSLSTTVTPSATLPPEPEGAAGDEERKAGLNAKTLRKLIHQIDKTLNDLVDNLLKAGSNGQDGFDAGKTTEDLLRDLQKAVKDFVARVTHQMNNRATHGSGGSRNIVKEDAETTTKAPCADCDTLVGVNPLPSLVQRLHGLLVSMERSVPRMG